MKVFGEIIARIVFIAVVLGLFLLALGCVAKGKSDEAEKVRIATAGVLIEGRAFYVGDSPNAVYNETVSLPHVNFLDERIEVKDALREWPFSFGKSSMPLRLKLEMRRRGELLDDPLTTDPAYLVDGYDVTASVSKGRERLELYPKAENAGYYVWCSRFEGLRYFWDCSIRADYPNQPSIEVRSRFTFRESLQERALRFPQIVQRMRDFVGCLDVTDKPFPQSEAAFLAAHRTMSGCL